jgi:6-pyruvoyltetrahydropterin/6-carboxytetrahydropterin synthase
MAKEKYTIRTNGEFESAHSIREYVETESGKFIDEPIHGHTWKIEAFIASQTVNQRTGFAIDFLDIKKKVDELCEYLDHKLINEVPPFDKINPSTENISKWFYDNIIEIVPERSYLERVVVWEGPNNYVIYEKK